MGWGAVGLEPGRKRTAWKGMRLNLERDDIKHVLENIVVKNLSIAKRSPLSLHSTMNSVMMWPRACLSPHFPFCVSLGWSGVERTGWVNYLAGLKRVKTVDPCFALPPQLTIDPFIAVSHPTCAAGEGHQGVCLPPPQEQPTHPALG